jgi:hypothetical protein
MTDSEKNELRVRLLQVLSAAGDIGRPADRLLTDARMAGFDTLTVPTLKIELRTLADKGWAIAFEPLVGGTRYRITALGTSVLQEQGLA